MTSVPQALDLAMRYYQAGDLRQAELLYRQILEVAPRHIDALHLLGLIAHQFGHNDVAVEHIRQVVALKPDFAEAHNNLGVALLELGRTAEALAHFQEALRLKPAYPAAHNNLSDVYREQGRTDDALAHAREALRLQPDYAEAHNNLGNIYWEQGRGAEAEESFREALRLNPAFVDAYNNLGNALWSQGKTEEALAAYREALRLRPDFARAHNNLGYAFLQLGRPAEAVACFRRALESAPDHPEVHKNLGVAYLMQGDFVCGWPEYEWRLRCKDAWVPATDRPAWDGGPLGGRTILLHAEQGLGDTLQFVRYAPLVKGRGGRVVLACQPELLNLLAGCPGVDQIIARGGSLPPFDVYAMLLSLPGLFGTTPASIPAPVPYVSAPAPLIEHWRGELARYPGLKVGIAWQGSRGHRGDRRRSVPVNAFAPLAVDGVSLLSLQEGDGKEQLAGARFPVAELPRRPGEPVLSLADAAAVMKNLDLVVTVDTAVAHLAGALGVPVWVALTFAPDWRWLLGRDDSPWYPTMRLFRQEEPGDWDGVFARLAGELTRLVAESGRPPTIRVAITPGELQDRIVEREVRGVRKDDGELAGLRAVRDQTLAPSEALAALTAELRAVHEALRQADEEINRLRQGGDFGPCFVELARTVFEHEERRVAIRREIDGLFDPRGGRAGH